MSWLSSGLSAMSRLRALAAALVALVLIAPGSVLATAPLVPISEDPFTQATCAESALTNHHTEVEPDTFANGSTIVAAFQVGRVYDGGSCAIGFATSTDNGATWTGGLLPGITKWSGAGPNNRASDPSVAFDAKHNAWLISSLTLRGNPIQAVGVVASRSTDGGHTWSGPFTTAAGRDVDKNWIVCDNTATSRFYGNCYTEWDNNGAGNLLQMSVSSDGGQTWSAPRTNNAGVLGGQPVVRPDGTVIVPTANANESAIGAFNSTDGGATWSALTSIATVQHHRVAGGLREGPLPSAEIDGAGTVYVVWADCRFRRRCMSNDIVISHSLNATGTSWSAVSRVPIDPSTSGVDHFIPGLAVNRATSGASAQLAITYYFDPPGTCRGTCQLYAGFISSADAGSSWTVATQLGDPFSMGWIAATSQGRMVGDYLSTSFGSDNAAHPVLISASAPTSGTVCSNPLDNCLEAVQAFAAQLVAAAGAVSSANDPVVYTGTSPDSGGLWSVASGTGSQRQ